MHGEVILGGKMCPVWRGVHISGVFIEVPLHIML